MTLHINEYIPCFKKNATEKSNNRNNLKFVYLYIMSRLETFETIEALKANRVERKLSSEEIERQKRATDSLSVFRLKRKPAKSKMSI